MHEKPKHERFQGAGEREDNPYERQKVPVTTRQMHQADISHAEGPYHEVRAGAHAPYQNGNVLCTARRRRYVDGPENLKQLLLTEPVDGYNKGAPAVPGSLRWRAAPVIDL